VRLRKLVDSESQSVECSPIGRKGSSKLILILAFSLKARKTISHHARHCGTPYGSGCSNQSD